MAGMAAHDNSKQQGMMGDENKRKAPLVKNFNQHALKTIIIYQKAKTSCLFLGSQEKEKKTERKKEKSVS